MHSLKYISINKANLNKSVSNNSIMAYDNCTGFENSVTKRNMNTANTGLKCIICDNCYNHKYDTMIIIMLN